MAVGPIELEDALADDSLEMNEAGDKLRVALALQDAIAAHKTRHQDGGPDELDVTGLSGKLADAQTPLAHKASHQDGGADELVVTGLSGLLADPQTAGGLKTATSVVAVAAAAAPTAGQVLTASSGTAAAWAAPAAAAAHKASHQDGGADELVVTGLSGLLADPQTAGGIKTATGVVVVGTSPAPTQGQVLVAGSAVGAAWATLSQPGVNGFRLEPIADPSTIPADGAYSEVCLVPVSGNQIALYYNSTWGLYSSDGTSYTLAGRTAGLPFDVFAYWTGGAVALEVLNWASATARATPLTWANGVPTKSSDATRRYLGTVRPRSATTYRVQRANRIDVGSVGIDYWNISNRRQTGLTLLGGGNYGYTSTAFRQAGALATAQVDAIAGVAGDPVALSLLTGASTTHTSDVLASVAIGQNNTTPIGPRNSVSLRPGVVAQELAAFAAPTGPLGVTAYLWLEAGGTAVTFFGDNGAATTTGLTASVWY